MSRYIVIYLLFFQASCFSQVIIQGRILDEFGAPIQNAQVQASGWQLFSNQSGRFLLRLSESDIYQLQITHPDYFTTTHTWANQEVKKSPEGKLPDITLVRKKKGRVLFAFGGDVMLSRRYLESWFGETPLVRAQNEEKDARFIFKHLKPYMTLANISSVNLETTIGNFSAADSSSKGVLLQSPEVLLYALKWAGIDHVSLGNNHIYDYGEAGLITSLQSIQKSGLMYSGAGLDQTSAYSPAIYSSAKYALYSMMGWSGSDHADLVAGPNKGGAALGKLRQIQKFISMSAQQGQIPILQYHGGLEYQDHPTLVTENRLKIAIENGAALAIAHHPHRLQGFEVYQNKLIAYSLGNLAFDQFYPQTQLTAILYVWMDEQAFHRAEIIPFYLKGYIPTPATGQHRHEILSQLYSLSKARNTKLTASGGHAIIQTKSQTDTQISSGKMKAFHTNQKIFQLPNKPWHQSLKTITSSDPELRLRLGRNLIYGSDFENDDTFEHMERHWFTQGFRLLHNNNRDKPQNKLMSAHIQPYSSALLGMKDFRRVFIPDNPYTVTFNLQSKKDVQVRAY
ncbi:CapA family protein [Algicola sagamiensis]|uniref:CapA family protein n=1 Tax=Algicola sagamiensis TaxID=163869 RepID=UPI0003766926|nr:CapA family protein [Algicola sagamiensis]